MHFLGTIDILFVILYLVIIGGVSVWSIRKKRGTPSDYFLANRNLGWWVIGASILASNVGVQTQVRLIAFKSTKGYEYDPGTLREIWLPAPHFYRILQEWQDAFQIEWAKMPKVPA